MNVSPFPLLSSIEKPVLNMMLNREIDPSKGYNKYEIYQNFNRLED